MGFNSMRKDPSFGCAVLFIAVVAILGFIAVRLTPLGSMTADPIKVGSYVLSRMNNERKGVVEESMQVQFDSAGTPSLKWVKHRCIFPGGYVASLKPGGVAVIRVQQVMHPKDVYDCKDGWYIEMLVSDLSGPTTGI